MKSLDVLYHNVDKKLPMESIFSEFDRFEPVDINVINWENYPYLPDVKFHIFYSDYAIYIKYVVKEKSVLATKCNINDQVFKDSCVEFFVAPGDGLYHNFEFNAIGAFLAGAQEGRGKGSLKSPEKLSIIRTLPSLGTEAFGEKKEETSWTLAVEIPFELFTEKTGKELSGTSMKANFYKCGDETETPHFVTWNNIDTENPDYHRPEYFGVINLK